LSTSNGSWTGSPTSYGYQWEDCNSSGAGCTNISGAASSSYTLGSGDVGHTIRAMVTATNAGGSASASSAQTATVTATGSHTSSCFSSPMVCGFPDPAAPVGNSAHVGPSQSCASMTQVNGNVTTSSSGQTIQNETINGMLYINQPNVTVNNVCVITPDSASGPSIYIGSGANNTLVENTSAGAVDRNSQNMESAVYNWSSNPATLDHDYFYNCGECIHDGNETVSNSYVIANGMDNSGDHREIMFDTDTSDTFTHDTLLVPPENTPQVAIVFASGNPAGSTLTMTNNLMAGGDQMLEAGITLNIQNNHFARCTTPAFAGTSDGYTACDGYTGASSKTDGAYLWDSHGYWPDGGTTGTGGSCSGQSVWSGNIWDDNGSAVNC
jgi:hypothetical protein